MSNYEILGVSKRDSIEDIKKSYKKLCLKHHPDVSKQDPKIFIQIKEAYEYLLENHKKDKNSYNNIFYDMFKTMNTKKNKNLTQVIFLDVSIEEAVEGIAKELNVHFEVPCPRCSTITQKNCKECKSFGYKKEYKKDKFEFNNITHQNQSFFYKKFYKDINLDIRININNTSNFRIKGKNVESLENISIFKSILGGEFEVKTLRGTEKIQLPSGNTSDFIYLLKRKGLNKGNQLIKFKINVPKNLTEQQEMLLNKIIYEEAKKKKTEFSSPT